MLAAAVLVTAGLLPFSSAETEEGVIHTGVGTEDEARSFPCPPGSTGPVVCVPDQGTSWRLTSDATGECSEGPVGWYGDCVRAFDAGDHLRVWGTRGVPPRAFRISWYAPQPAADDGGRAAPTGENAPDQNGTTSSGDSSTPPAPLVASPQRGSGAFAAQTDPAPEPEPSLTAPRRDDREVPGGVFWDPPASEVPGYSDLVAAPGPTYPHVPATIRGRGDAGAPAAAGAVALLAAGWVLREHRRSGRTDEVG